jgi:ubiquinone/menaquinone biosynthesis C-methylase UbiE
MNVPKPSESSRETIDRHLSAVYPSFALLAGVRLDVFTVLKDGPMTAEDLAQAMEVSAFKLETLLYALVMADLLVADDGNFANTAEADFYLVQGRPSYIGRKIAYYAERWAADLKTAESIRTGIPQGKLDFTSMSDSQLTAFYNSGNTAAIAAGRRLAETYDLCNFDSLLDVAGGSGGLAIGACQRCPELQATVIDLPTVTPITQRFVDEAGMDGRVKVLSLDVVDRAPESRYDVATVANLIQVLTRDQARGALLNVGRALVPRGVLFILGWVLDDSQLSPPEIAASNFAFLNIYDEGRAFTEAAHRVWLVEAGFSTFQRTLLPSGESIIRAEKADI